MTDDSKKRLPDLSSDLDPDATAVVDARSVWAALERVEGPRPAEANDGPKSWGQPPFTPGGPSATFREPPPPSPRFSNPPTPTIPTAPPPALGAHASQSVRPPRPQEEEDLDQAWEDSFDMSDLATTREGFVAMPEEALPPPFTPEAEGLTDLAAEATPDREVTKRTTRPPRGGRSTAAEEATTAPPPVPDPAPTRPALREDTEIKLEEATVLDSDLLVEDPDESSRPVPSQSGISTARPPEDPSPSARPRSPSTIVTPLGMPSIAAPSTGVLVGDSTAPEPSRRRQGPSAVEMEDLFSIGDFVGAMDIAEELLTRDPQNADATECYDRCRAALRTIYTEKLGPLDRVPLVAIPREQLRWLTIDHRAGFILSHVDGISNLEEIVDISGMPELEALRILAELAQQRIIAFR